MQKDNIQVWKIGGAVIDDPEALRAFLAEFAAMPGPKVLVHGGGRAATALSKRLGIETKMIEGRRVTDAATLDIATMVYAGLANKQIVAQLQALGCNAIGLCGADANAIKAHKRPAEPIDYGFVGDIDSVNAPMLKHLTDAGIVPVLCAITHDGNGQLLNTNADSVAQSVATAMAQLTDVELCYSFEQLGVMRDIADPASLIKEITPALYAQLKADGTISGGMIPKLDNAFRAISAGVKSVTIGATKIIDR
ncbi:MAG: acetylglutamate kinase [Bacteroidales bacterium]|nr:acetylglutamate kinase [Bacteroidales bacterium]